jgi:hypothetical protein
MEVLSEGLNVASRPDRDRALLLELSVLRPGAFAKEEEEEEREACWVWSLASVSRRRASRSSSSDFWVLTDCCLCGSLGQTWPVSLLAGKSVMA